MDLARVRTGSEHDCVDCGVKIAKGSIAYVYSRKAETYRERCSANSKGLVSWYHCQKCVKIGETTT